MLTDWMCLAFGRDPEEDAGNYNGEMAPCRLFQAGDGTPSRWEQPGKTFSLEGRCSSPAPVFLPAMVVQRVSTLEPSRRWVALSLWTRDKNKSL